VPEQLPGLAGFVITNAGKATVKGLEVDMQAKPASWLTIAAGAAWNDARYDFFQSEVADFSGQQFIFSPRYSGYLSAEGRWPIAGLGGDFVLRGNVRGQSKVYFDHERRSTAAGEFAAKPYALVNGQVGLAFDNGVEVFLFARNLTDKLVLKDRSTDSFNLGLTRDVYAPPREIGVRVDFSF
jgi:iron complex outermembrane receptor protein